MNNKLKNILSFTCIISCIICVILTYWGNIKNNGTITTDSYIGIIATLIGICATIIVGFQIISFFELQKLKHQVVLVEKQRKELEEYKNTLEKELHTSKTGISNAFGMLSVIEEDSLLGVIARVCSIVCDDLNFLPGDILLKRYQYLYNKLSFFLKTDDYIDSLSPIIDNLKYIDIPRNKEHYNEIMKIHFDVISMIEEAKERIANKHD